MKIEIKDRWDGHVIYSCEAENIKEAVEKAVKERVSLNRASLDGASLNDASLDGASLNGASLDDASLNDASLDGASLNRASLNGASLNETKYLVKTMGVECGNYYWKRFDSELNNNNFQFYVGLNILRKDEVFASDERVLCSYPGFHFASRSWCAVNYRERKLEAKIRIPEEAQINEPWATDGKASADMIEIIQVFDVETGADVTDQYRRPEEKKVVSKKDNKES